MNKTTMDKHSNSFYQSILVLKYFVIAHAMNPTFLQENNILYFP